MSGPFEILGRVTESYEAVKLGYPRDKILD
jgi:hypothetical protein